MDTNEQEINLHELSYQILDNLIQDGCINDLNKGDYFNFGVSIYNSIDNHQETVRNEVKKHLQHLIDMSETLEHTYYAKKLNLIKTLLKL